MNLKQSLALAGVTICAFVFNCSEFMPVGLLTDIGNTFGTTEAQTGMIVTVYAWFVMIFSVPLMILGTRLNYRTLFLVVIAVFFVGQVLTVFAVSYWMLMFARIVVATAHCVFWAIGAPLSVRLVDFEKRSFALSMFEIGAASALVVGMPIGRTIGLFLGWRAAFGVVAVMAAVMFVYVAKTLPSLPSEHAYKFSQFPTIFKNKGLVAMFILTALYSWGYYVGYSYIEPFLLQVAELEESVITIALSVLGIAGVTACLFSSKFYPKYRFRVIFAITLGVPLALFFMFFVAKLTDPTPVLITCIIWGMCGTSVTLVYQAEIINVSSPEEETVAMAFFSAIFNFGIGSGAFIGGRVVDTLGIQHVFSVGGVIGTAALLFCFFVAVPILRRYKVKM